MPNVEIDEAELANLRQAGADAAAALEAATQREATANEQRDAATNALADSLRAANPDIPPDAISGATPDELRASADRARSIATAAIEAHAAANPTPATTPTPATAGQAAAPARTTETPTGLRGAERIKAALDARKETA